MRPPVGFRPQVPQKAEGMRILPAMSEPNPRGEPAAAITALITGYTKGILRSNRFALTIFGILIFLYAYLYIVLQLEDYALIMGSIGLLAVLTTVMYITRKIDWYSVGKDQGK